MKVADYKCEKCDQIKEVWTKDTEVFSKYVLCECGGRAGRIFTPVFTICHQGRAGNSKNGYTSNPTEIKKT